MESRIVVTAHSIAYLEATLAEIEAQLKCNSTGMLYTHLVVIKDALEELLHCRRQGRPLIHPHPDPRCTCGPESRCSYCW